MPKAMTRDDEIIEEIRRILIDLAKQGKTITYSDLVARIQTVRVVPNSLTLSGWLTLISEDEYAAGRGLLSALVIRKADPRILGTGFFNLAPIARCKPENWQKCWRRSLDKVFAYWQRHQLTRR